MKKKQFITQYLWLFLLLTIGQSPRCQTPAVNGSLLEAVRNAPQHFSMGNFEIKVEKYHSTGLYHPGSQTYKGVSGVGRIQLPCLQDGENSIQVRFDSLIIQATPGTTQLWVVKSGVAQFPVEASSKAFQLTLGAFHLEISHWIITPQNSGAAKARLLLPASLASGLNFKRESLDLGDITLTGRCEFYKSMPGEKFGPMTIANTPISVGGTGFIADFSSISGAAPGGSEMSWKGVILLNGTAKGEKSGTVYSNAGFLHAPFQFINASVQNDGFYGNLSAPQAYIYFPVLPANYTIETQAISIRLEKNKVVTGQLSKVALKLPKEAVRDNIGATISVPANTLAVNSSLDLVGKLDASGLINKVFCWGDLTKPEKNAIDFGIQAENGYVFFPGSSQSNFFPVSGTTFVEPAGLEKNTWTNDHVKKSGLTGVILRSCREFYLQSPDVPNPAQAFPLGTHSLSFKVPGTGWVSIQGTGVHASISSLRDVPDSYYVGNPAATAYVGKVPFNFGVKPNNILRLSAQWVESSVFNANLSGGIDMNELFDAPLSVKDLTFSSTAHLGAGKVILANPVQLKDWGLGLEKNSAAPHAGLMIIKTGQVIMTGAGLREKRHFARPFLFHWGEFFADGSIGRLFFDFYSPGQQFDGLDFSPEAIALSKDIGNSHFIQVGGAVSYPFFGAKYINVKDHFRINPSLGDRWVELSSGAPTPGFRPNENSLAGTWSDDLARMAFMIDYNKDKQDGFIGTGSIGLQSLAYKQLPGGITINNTSLCIIEIDTSASDSNYVLQLGPVDTIAYWAEISGELCVEKASGDFGKLQLTGKLRASTNARMGSIVEGDAVVVAELLITLKQIEFNVRGKAVLNMKENLSLYGDGQFWLNYKPGDRLVKGWVKGRFSAIKDDILYNTISAVASATGQANWHIGTDYQSVQGSVIVGIMAGPGSGVGVSAGFTGGLYMGVNAPKSEAWIISGLDKFQHPDIDFLPETLTGMYFFGQIKAGINLPIISGGYELSAGLGIFWFQEGEQVRGFMTPATNVLTFPKGVQVFGLLGGSIYGDILDGVVSARAGFNLQLGLPEQFQFKGTVFLEGCLFFVCKDVTLSLGYDSGRKGFFIQ